MLICPQLCHLSQGLPQLSYLLAKLLDLSHERLLQGLLLCHDRALLLLLKSSSVSVAHLRCHLLVTILLLGLLRCCVSLQAGNEILDETSHLHKVIFTQGSFHCKAGQGGIVQLSCTLLQMLQGTADRGLGSSPVLILELQEGGWRCTAKVLLVTAHHHLLAHGNVRQLLVGTPIGGHALLEDIGSLRNGLQLCGPRLRSAIPLNCPILTLLLQNSQEGLVSIHFRSLLGLALILGTALL
mmetsp:Transcript_52774/g.126049  ORF Transcript_52774/g.126049 Transcript_52774/m.126049 type:complete len:240 (-) Transcript_52774:903-1622(-)